MPIGQNALDQPWLTVSNMAQRKKGGAYLIAAQNGKQQPRGIDNAALQPIPPLRLAVGAGQPLEPLLQVNGEGIARHGTARHGFMLFSGHDLAHIS
jgi:hypothetical protein